MVVTAGPVHVAVLEFFLRGLAHFGDLDFEVEVLACQRMVAVDGDHVALDAGDRDHARVAIGRLGLELHAGLQVRDFAERALRHALDELRVTFAVTVGRRDLDAEFRSRRLAFELAFEFRLTAGANSGLKYYVDTELNKAEGSAIGLEYQLLDDALHPDAKMGRGGNRTLASLYDLIAAAKTKKVNPIGEWNVGRIVSDGRHVEHWLNGEKVVEYERGSDAFRKLVAMSKYKIWPAFGERPRGPVLLQDHGNRVSFRNVKIREPRK